MVMLVTRVAAGRRKMLSTLMGAVLLAAAFTVAGAQSIVKGKNLQKRLDSAAQLYRSGYWKKAADECRKLLKENPDFAAAHQLLGRALERGGDAGAAMAEYREAIRVQPQNDEVHYRIARILTMKGENDGAIGEYREAVRLKPDEARYHAALAIALDQRGKYQLALEEYKTAHQLDPKNVAYRLMYEGLAKDVESAQSGADQVYSVEDGVTEPVPIFRVDPSYSEEGRDAHVQGGVTLKIVIGTNGSVSSVRVVKPLGFGLDESAVEAVGTWRFQPATRNGQPVSVRVTVGMSFRLF